MKNKRIFIVDDDVLILKIGRSALQDKYTVIPVTSGQKLLEMLTTFDADIILLDIGMPEMDGYEVLKKLKRNPKTSNIPVILMAGKNDEDREEGFALGATEYINKPFSTQLLQRHIERLLLLEKQKNELKKFSNDLNLSNAEGGKTAEEMERSMLIWATEVLGFNAGDNDENKEKMEFCLKALLAEMKKSDLYKEEMKEWNIDIDLIAQSAALHDIGKIIVPSDILQKLNRLSNEEFEQIKKHTFYGKSLIENLKSRLNDKEILDIAQTMAFLHHERWDGNGYPLGLKGDDIPLLARAVAVIDVYMALTSNRVYKDAISHEEAVQTIVEGSGTQFDPNIVSLFLSISDQLV